jgi:septal ring factor EnvC (AmiA/AmiB activator)
MQNKIATLFFIFLTSLAWGQLTQEELEQRKNKIQQEIQEKERMLQEVRGKEKSVTKLLQIQKEKIGLKQKLISTTEKQAKLLSNNMYINQVEINKLKKDLVVLKDDYAEMIVKSYKSRSQQSRAMFLLSSQNFLQAYKRLQYMKQYSSYRKMQGNEIKDKSVQLADHNAKLSGQKTEKEKLLAEQEKQRADLVKEKQEQEKIANSLKKDKKQIIAEIKKKQQESRKIDAQIQKMIRDAIA